MLLACAVAIGVASPSSAQPTQVLPDAEAVGQSAVDKRPQAPLVEEDPELQQAEGDVITVRGSKERQSSWRRAETANVIVYSNGSERDLLKLTANIERLHHVLGQLFDHDREGAAQAKPLEIVLIGGRNFIRSMRLADGRTQDGPYSIPFTGRRYYDPRPDGAVLAISRSRYDIPIHEIDPVLFESDDELTAGDQEISFDELDQLDDLDDGFNADSAFSTPGFPSPRTIANGGARRPNLERRPIRRPWQSQVYDAYARHYFMTYLAGAFPAWYLDGIGNIFANLDVRDEGALEYGRQPVALRTVMRTYEAIDTRAILSGDYLGDPDKHLWTPDHAWALTHYFLFGQPTAEQRAAFMRYMAEVAVGVPQSEAAQSFTDFDALDASVMEYVAGDTFYFWRPVGPTAETDPIAYRLTRAEAAMLEADVSLGARLAQSQSESDKSKYLASLREDAAREGFSEPAFAVVAEAECAAGEFAACKASAQRILANDPASPVGLTWKAVALLNEALASSESEKPAALRRARSAIIAANRADTEAPRPLIAFFDSFVEAGETVPGLAMLGMLKVIELVPAAPQPRLRLGRELVRRGLHAEAQALLLPLVAGGYTPEEADEARSLLQVGTVAAEIG